MSYTKTTDFASKDVLVAGDPLKLIKGVELGAEFDAIQAADALNMKSATLAATGGSDLVGFIQSGTGASTSLTVQDKLRETVSVKDFGATGDGVTDDTTNVQAAFTAAAAANKSVVVPDGTYLVNGLTLTCSMVMQPDALLKYNGADNGTLMTVSGSGLHIPFFHSDANAINCLQLYVTGDDNTIGTVVLDNGVASASASASIVGMNIAGDRNKVDRISINNFTNTGYANLSYPQGVLLYGTDNHVNTMTADGCAAALVISSASGTNHVESLYVQDATDNGVYHLGGTLHLGTLTCVNGEEPYVFAGGSAAVGEINLIGANDMIGFQNCDRVHIGRITVTADSNSQTTNSLFRTRVTNTNCGEIYIGSISGVMVAPGTLWKLDVGTIDYLTIDSIDLKLVYDSAAMPSSSLTSFATFSGCQGFSFRDFDIRIVELTQGTTFDGSSAGVVSLANDTITLTGHPYETGDGLIYRDGGGTAITGLTDATTYYAIKVDANTIKLASSLANAQSNTPINLTGLGVGTTHTLGTLDSANAFWMTGPTTNLLRQSYVGSIRVSIYKSDAETQSEGTFRGANFAQNLIAIKDGYYVTNSGPYLMKRQDTLPTNMLFTGTIPSIGTWKRGTVFWNLFTAAGGSPGWVCVSAGTPGTWKEMATVAP